MDEQQKAQNKKINQHSRRLNRLEEFATTTKLDLEPIVVGNSTCFARRNAPAFGRISQGFEAMEEEFSQINRRLDRLEQRQEYQFNQMAGKLENIMQALTRIQDLPEE